MDEENDNKKSDIELDIETLSDMRDYLCHQITLNKNIVNKSLLVESLIKIIKARQESELFQLKIWGIIEDYEQNSKNPNNSN